MAKTLSRRDALKVFAGVTLLPLVGCGGQSSGAENSGDGTENTGGAGGSAGSASSGGSGGNGAITSMGGSGNVQSGGAYAGGNGGSAANGSGGSLSAPEGGLPDGGNDAAECSEVPNEVLGPFPADGSNGPNYLNTSGIVRSDITSSFGPLTGTADGIPLSLTLTLLDASGGCAALEEYAIYLWHCDRDGNYSVYSPIPDQNYLRGVQATDATGSVTFTTIFPGAYPGRWPHFHVQIFRSLADAAAGVEIKTSQLALPQDACNAAYATTGYEASATVLSQMTLAQDLSFGDGVSTQMVAVTGNPVDGFRASVAIAVVP